MVTKSEESKEEDYKAEWGTKNTELESPPLSGSPEYKAKSYYFDIF